MKKIFKEVQKKWNIKKNKDFLILRDFKEEINPYFEKTLEFEVNKDNIANGIKITTVAILSDDVVCGPTPMFNPPLLIPIDEINVKCNDLINVKLKYIMGEGIETIKTQLV